MIDGSECPSPTAPIRSVASVRHSDPPSCPAFIFVFSSDQVAIERWFSKNFLCFVCRNVAHGDSSTQCGQAHAVPAGSWGSTVQSINIVVFSLRLSFTTGGLSATVLESDADTSFVGVCGEFWRSYPKINDGDCLDSDSGGEGKADCVFRFNTSTPLNNHLHMCSLTVAVNNWIHGRI